MFDDYDESDDMAPARGIIIGVIAGIVIVIAAVVAVYWWWA